MKSRKSASKKAKENVITNWYQLHSIEKEIGPPAAEGDTTRVFELLAEAELYSHGDKSTEGYRDILIKATSSAIYNDKYELADKLLLPETTAEVLCLAIHRIYHEKARDGRWAEKIVSYLDHEKEPEYTLRILRKVHDKTEGSFNTEKCYRIALNGYDIKIDGNDPAVELYTNPKVNRWIRAYTYSKDKKEYDALVPPPEIAMIIVEHALNLDLEKGEEKQVIDLDTFKKACDIARGIKKERAKLIELRKDPIKHHNFDPPTPTKPFEPSEAVVNLREKIINQLNSYLKLKVIAHKDRAQALATCVSKLVTVRSIHDLIDEQVKLMKSGKVRSEYDTVYDDPLSIVRSNPKRVSQNKLGMFTPKGMEDYTTRLENCLTLAKQYDRESEMTTAPSQKI